MPFSHCLVFVLALVFVMFRFFPRYGLLQSKCLLLKTFGFTWICFYIRIIVCWYLFLARRMLPRKKKPVSSKASALFQVRQAIFDERLPKKTTATWIGFDRYSMCIPGFCFGPTNSKKQRSSRFFWEHVKQLRVFSNIDFQQD